MTVVTDARELGEVPRASGGFWPGRDGAARLARPLDAYNGHVVRRRMQGPHARPRSRRATLSQGGDSEHRAEDLEEDAEGAAASAPQLGPRPRPLGKSRRGGPSEPSADPDSGSCVAAPQIQVPLSRCRTRHACHCTAARFRGRSEDRRCSALSVRNAETSPGRSAIQAGPNSPPYFPEFEDSPVYQVLPRQVHGTPGRIGGAEVTDAGGHRAAYDRRLSSAPARLRRNRSSSARPARSPTRRSMQNDVTRIWVRMP